MNKIIVERKEKCFILKTTIGKCRFQQRYERIDFLNPTYVENEEHAKRRFSEYVIMYS